MGTKVVLVEDDKRLASLIGTLLEIENFDMTALYTGKNAVEQILAIQPDIVVLDLMLPEMNGIEICRQLRPGFTNPILMLTAKSEESDVVLGLGVGADDYVTKPFELRELALRCQALARRNQLHQEKTISIGPLTIDESNHSATREEQELKLTNIGFTILLTLARAHPKPVSRSALMHTLWGDEPPDTDALRSHIYSLRAVLDKPFEKAMLKTITNVGFRLEYDNDHHTSS